MRTGIKNVLLCLKNGGGTIVLLSADTIKTASLNIYFFLRLNK